MPPGHIRIPYHMIFNIKSDGRQKCRPVAGDHRTPDVYPEESCSSVVAMDTIQTAFVLAALNGLNVHAADISTAFLHVKM